MKDDDEIIIIRHNITTSNCFINLKNTSNFAYCDENDIIIFDYFENKLSYLKSHTDEILYLTQLKNENLISCSKDTLIKIWDIKNKKCIIDLEGHEDWVNYIIELNENKIASSSIDYSIRIWNIINYICLNILKGHKDWVNCLVQINDKEIASASDDYLIKFWNFETGEEKNIFFDCQNCVKFLVKIDVNNLLSIDNEGNIIIWDLKESNKSILKMKFERKDICNCYYLNDERISLITEDLKIYILNLNTQTYFLLK